MALHEFLAEAPAAARPHAACEAVVPAPRHPAPLPVAPSMRRALPGDARVLWSLCREAAAPAAALAPEMPLPLREALFETPCRSWAWLAELGGEAVGVVVASAGLVLPQGGYCLAVDAVHVRPDWRGRGIGTRLQAHALAMAADMGCQGLRLADGRLLRADAPGAAVP